VYTIRRRSHCVISLSEGSHTTPAKSMPVITENIAHLIILMAISEM
jgi:hypothetical protein